MVEPDRSPRSSQHRSTRRPQPWCGRHGRTRAGPWDGCPGPVRRRPPLREGSGLSRSFDGVPAVQEGRVDHRATGPRDGCDRCLRLGARRRGADAARTRDAGRRQPSGSTATRGCPARARAPGGRHRVGGVVQDPGARANLRPSGGASDGCSRTPCPAGRSGGPRGGLADPVDAALVRWDSTELRSRARATLSGGQRQRLAIARALATSPEVVVLDEPVTALDATVQDAVLTLLERLRDETGVAMVFVSHDLRAVRRMADEVLVVHDGRVGGAGPRGTRARRAGAPGDRAPVDAAPARPAPDAARRRRRRGGARQRASLAQADTFAVAKPRTCPRAETRGAPTERTCREARCASVADVHRASRPTAAATSPAGSLSDPGLRGVPEMIGISLVERSPSPSRTARAPRSGRCL